MDYKTFTERPLSYYSEITSLSFNSMEKDKSYILYGVKGEFKPRNPLFGLFKRKPIMLEETTFKHHGSLKSISEIDDSSNGRKIFVKAENAIYDAPYVSYWRNGLFYDKLFKTNEEAYNYYLVLKKRCEEAGVKFPSS